MNLHLPIYMKRICFFSIYGLGDVLSQKVEQYLEHRQQKTHEPYSYQRTLKQSIFGLLFGKFFYPLSGFKLPKRPRILPIRVPPLFTWRKLALANGLFTLVYFYYWNVANRISTDYLHNIIFDTSVLKKVALGFFTNGLLFYIFFKLCGRGGYLARNRRRSVLLILHTAVLSFLQHNNIKFQINIRL
jgi:hypothetical protein